MVEASEKEGMHRACYYDLLIDFDAKSATHMR
jgi:hypothetical protein